MEITMNLNATLRLTGFLGEDAKRVSKDGKNYTILSVATTDSYPTDKNDEIVWIEKEAVWHSVFVFKPATKAFASELKKGNKVNIKAALSYEDFKDSEGFNRKHALIEGLYIETINYNKQERLFSEEIIGQVANSMKN